MADKTYSEALLQDVIARLPSESTTLELGALFLTICDAYEISARGRIAIADMINEASALTKDT